MPSASAYKPEQRFFALFIGRSGDGKSLAADSFPRPLLDLDFDFRFRGVVNGARQGIVNLDLMDYHQFNPRGGWGPVEDKLNQFEMTRMSSGTIPYKTITVNSLTSLTRLFVNASHQAQGGRTIGKLRVSGPADFNFEATATHQTFDFFRSWPCNVIATAHIIDKYGKPPKEFDKDGNWTNQYVSSEVIGEKLSIRDNLGENVLSYFDDVYRFSRDDGKYYVEFATDIAKNSYGIPPGKHDITNKNFYDFFTALVAKQNYQLGVVK